MTATRTRRVGVDVIPDAALLAVALAAGLGAGRLTRSPGAAHVIVPIAACVVTGHLVTTVVRRLRAPDPVPSIAGVVGVALMSVWTLIPSATRSGFPTATTIRALLHQFSQAGIVIRSHPTPLPATSGVVLCLAAGAGLAAVFARTLWSWQDLRPPGSRRPLISLFPTFGLFCYTALLSSDRDRLAGAAAYLATALLFLAVADRPRPSRRARPVFWRTGTSAALAMAALAVGVPVAASSGLAGLRLDAIPFSHGGTSGGVGGTGGPGTPLVSGIGALNLIDNMHAVLSAHSGLVMFTARTPKATYWQVANLTRFNGQAWLPDLATAAAAHGAPQLSPVTLPILPTPVASRTFTAHIAIGNLRSTLLPVPPDTVKVANAAVVQVEPGIGATQPSASPSDLTYDAVARVPTALKSTPPTVAALQASIPPSGLAPYIQLPVNVSPAVVQLAHTIVAKAHTPAAMAAALVRYFTQGKRFRYTLTPPSVPGTDALSAFLFTTRAGFCQQFAGAYAALARIDGLPTRLAIGFTTGTAVKRNTYTVTGADAHSWPQVYLGPEAGWVSFEPTPASSNELPGAGVLNGTPTTKPSHKPGSVTTTTLSEKRIGQGAKPASGANGLGSNALSSPTTPRSSTSAGEVVLLALATIAAILIGAVAGPWLWRRRKPRLRRRPFARARAPKSEILARWEQAESVLERTGLGRRPSETISEHAARLVDRQTRPLVAYRALASLAARVSYAPDPCTEADVDEARRLSEELRLALRQRESANR